MDRITERGDAISQRRLRAELDGRGSPPRLRDLISAYHTERIQSLERQADAMSEDLRRAIATEMSTVASRATAELERQLQGERQSCHDLSEELTDTQRAMQDAVDREETLGHQVAALEKQTQSLRSDLATARAEVESRREAAEISRMEAARAELLAEQTRQTAERLSQHNADLEARLRSSAEQIAAAQQQAAVAQAHQQRISEALEEARSEMSRLHGIVDSHHATIEALGQQLARAEREAAVADQRADIITMLQRDLELAHGRCATLEQRLETQRTQRDGSSSAGDAPGLPQDEMPSQRQTTPAGKAPHRHTSAQKREAP